MENSKNAIIAVMTVAIIAMTISAATLILAIGIQNRIDTVRDNTEALSSQLSLTSVDTSSGSGFMIKEYNGVIGIFDGTGALQDILDVDIKSLPEADRVMLGTGIWAASRRELASLIEDYTG